MGQKSEIRNGMRIDWDVPITMEDGIVLRADVYRLTGEGRFPVILTYGPYSKWLTFRDGYPDQWRIMSGDHPDVTAGSSNKYQNWEVVGPDLTTQHRPYHTHDEKLPLTPGEVYELDVEIWPICVVPPAGYRIALNVRGRDYVYPGGAARLASMKNLFTGVGPFLHDDPRDRPPKIFGGKVTLHTGGGRGAYVMLPIIPVGGSM